MFGKSDMLEHELDMLKIEVDSLKNLLELKSNHLWEVINADWFIYLQSKYTRFFNTIKDRCMLIIAKELPKIDATQRFRGGPAIFNYKKLTVFVTLCGLTDNIAEYHAVYDGGDLPEKIAKELFEFATAMYNERGAKK